MSEPPAPAATDEPDESSTRDAALKRAVSVSIGSSKRDAQIDVEFLGKRIRIERTGTNGNLNRAAKLIRELDGEVDAIGLGGLDHFVMAAGRRYYLRDGVRLAREAKRTPVVCGAGLKDTLERVAVEKLDELIGWKDRKVLMVSAVDRFGMAEALAHHQARVLYGDLIYALGLPLPIYDVERLELVARLLLPIVARLPISWIYPTGKQQESGKAGHRARYFEWAEVIAGDYHYIRRYAPERLDGKTILTNTTTAVDVAELRQRGVSMLVTTTPRFEGRSLPTNLLEAALVAAAGRHPLSPAEYREIIAEAGLEPRVERLNDDRP